MTATLPATVDAVALRAELAGGSAPRLLDVRTPGEFQAGHIEGAVNLPLDQLDAHAARIAGGTGRLAVVCQAGGRSTTAASRLAAAGPREVVVLEQGMNGWLAAGAPVERAETTRWALERQVRLVAGGLVASSILGSLWAPKLRFVAGGIGAGLVFAAVSDTCVMGSALMRLPYNRAADTDVRGAVDRLL
jgi:rhodanese-related sulfurtransferase